jgi:hypothetical protein
MQVAEFLYAPIKHEDDIGQNQMALYIAIYGAILSTLAILWNIWRDTQDRAVIKVDAKLREQWLFTGVSTKYICVELSNSGKRPITVKEISYRIGEQIYVAELSLRDSLPQELGEGQAHSVDILKEKIKDLNAIEFVIAKDA